MTYLIWQMLACLLVAFLLGMLLGWWLGRRRLHLRIERADEKWRMKLERKREELEACRAELAGSGGDDEALAACREKLEVCRRELAACVEARDSQAGKLEVCRADLEACRKDLETARTAPPAPGGDVAAAPIPLVDPGAGDVDAEAAAPEPDDLKRVEGIGPKIEGLLNAKGIITWAQLAAAEVAFLQSVLDEAGPRYRVHDPGTWPQQASLAADGAWDELEELQDRLKGGR